MNRDQLKLQLVADEGIKLSAYPDSRGFWTIGIGRLIDKRVGGHISLPEAYYLLNNDIDEKVTDLTTAFPWFSTLNDPRQNALINMCFNLGLTGLEGFHEMLVALQAGDFALAAQRMLASKWDRQVGDRAVRLAHEMETGLFK